MNQAQALFNNLNVSNYSSSSANTAPSTPKHNQSLNTNSSVNSSATPSSSSSSALSSFSNMPNSPTYISANSNNSDSLLNTNNASFQKRSELDLPLHPIMIRSQSNSNGTNSGVSTTPLPTNVATANSSLVSTPSSSKPFGNSSNSASSNANGKSLTFSPVLQVKSNNKSRLFFKFGSKFCLSQGSQQCLIVLF